MIGSSINSPPLLAGRQPLSYAGVFTVRAPRRKDAGDSSSQKLPQLHFVNRKRKGPNGARIYSFLRRITVGAACWMARAGFTCYRYLLGTGARLLPTLL